MTVPCGGTGVSREKRVQTSSRVNMRAPISELFVFRPFAQSSIVLSYSKIELLKNRRTVKILSGYIVAPNIYRQTASLSVGLSTEPFTTSSKPRFPTGRCSLRWISNSPDENGGENRLNKLSPWGWLGLRSAERCRAHLF